MGIRRHYTGLLGQTFSIVHKLIDLAGTGTVSGQAGANWNFVVKNDARATVALAVTVTEFGSTGWYAFALVPTSALGTSGVWTLEGTDPAGAGYSFRYTLQIEDGILALTNRDLTTLARVKERLFPGNVAASVKFDTMLGSLITEVSVEIQDQRMRGRSIKEASYTEYYDGTGTTALVLRQGPLVSVASVNEVVYADAGAGARGETLTELFAYQRHEYGLRSEGGASRGRLGRIDGGVFTRGAKNWKVAYTAGFDVLPEGLVGRVTDLVAWKWATREVAGLANKILEDGQISPLSPAQVDAEIRRMTAPWALDAAVA